jgi:PEP-CTERM motif
MNYLKKVATTVAFAAASIAVPASAAELVTNGGFETGSFSGWTLGGNTGFTGVSGGAVKNTGSFGAFFGPVGSNGTLSQVLNTVAGTQYSVSFDLRNTGGVPNFFDVLADGASVFQLTNSGGFPSVYTTFSGFLFTAATNATTLQLKYRQDPGFWYVDNVSVQGQLAAVPEPGTWALMLVGFGAVGSAMRSRSRLRSTKVSFA